MAPAPRKISSRLTRERSCAPLLRCYRWAEEFRARRWTDVEDHFLEAMWEFDANVSCGLATQGDVQNGKGDFFTDLLALLLENASGKQLWGRGKVPGLFYRHHLLDAYYPPEGVVEVLIETKASGAPPNPRQRVRQARPASQDLKKRITELGLKTIDLKAEFARSEGHGEGPAGDLQTWLRRARPVCVLFLAIRVKDHKDLTATLAHARVAQKILDHVGLVAYEQRPDGGGYRLTEQAVDLELDRTLSRVATLLRDLP